MRFELGGKGTSGDLISSFLGRRMQQTITPEVDSTWDSHILGHYTIGKDNFEVVLARLRKIAESCDSMQVLLVVGTQILGVLDISLFGWRDRIR